MEEYKMGLMSRVSRTDLIKINNNSRENSSRERSKERIAAMKLEQAVGVKKKKIELQKDCQTHQTSTEPPDSPRTKLRKELNLPPAPVAQSVDQDRSSPQRFLPNISVKRQFKMSDFDPRNPGFRENPLTIDEDRNSYLDELEQSKNYFDNQRAKFQSIASVDLLPEQKFGRLVKLNSPQSHKHMKGEKKQRFLNHKENRVYLAIQQMGQSNQDLKKQLTILKHETLQRKSIQNHGSILQLASDQDIMQADLQNSASRSIMSMRKSGQLDRKSPG